MRPINWAPSRVEEVIQNVRILLTTEPGTVPLSRALGTPQDLVDAPETVVGAGLQADVIRAVRTYEPRVKVKQVTLSADDDGRLVADAEIVAP
jgi:phage baseplate assembly protein W